MQALMFTEKMLKIIFFLIKSNSILDLILANILCFSENDSYLRQTL